MVDMRKVKCSHCGYKWETKSGLFIVTCPNCGRKTPNKKEALKDKEE